MSEYLPETDPYIDHIIDCVAVHEAIDEEYISIFGEEPTDSQALDFYQDKLEEQNNE